MANLSDAIQGAGAVLNIFAKRGTQSPAPLDVQVVAMATTFDGSDNPTNFDPAREGGNQATLLGLFQAGTARVYTRDLLASDVVSAQKAYRSLFADPQAGVVRTANGDTGSIDVTGLSELGISINVNAMSGTSPVLALQIQQLTPNGNWNYLWSPTNVTAVPAYPSTSVGAGLQTQNCFTNTIKVAWQLSGANPSFTFSIGLWGK